MDSLTGIAPRRLEALVPALMQDEPVVVLAGARTVGKSTLLRRLAGTAEVLDLDDPTTRGLMRDDLGFYAGGPSPVLVDEFQHVPELLDAIKAELNIGLRPGRFLLTGSTRYSALPRVAQSLTGRVHVLTVWPLSQGEIAGRPERLAEVLLDEPEAVLDRRVSGTDRLGYAERVLAGGLPAALHRRPGRPRSRWFEGYVDLVVQRDLLELRDVRRSSVLPPFLRRLAAQTGQVLNVAAASRAAGIDPSIGEDYVRLLEAVFLLHRLPSWGSTLSGRVNRLPKVHLVDTGLGGWLLGITTRAINRRVPAVLTEFGHLLESFVVNELLKQVSWLDRDLRVGHYRTSDGHEVDLVLESDDGDVVAVEVKAGATYRREDLRGLAHLRLRLGERFRAGVLMYTGERAARVDDRLFLVPVDHLWEL
ncbi:MAG: ATP-binding protein [Pseudonocardia sp.]|nr:ATP-binding protein [Pseudonocardia sp.]